MGARCTSQDADSMPISQKEQWREMLQENPQILLQLEYQKMQLSLLQEIREERLHYEDLLNRRLMQDKQFRRNDDFQLNDDFQRNDAFREISRVSASILPSHATTRYGCSSVDDSYLEEYSAFTAQEDAKISRTGSVSSSRQRRSYSVGSVQDLQKKLQKRTFNSQRRETLDMTNPILKRDPAVGGNKAIENGFGNRKTDRTSKESPSRANRNSNSDSGSSSKQNDSYPEFEENWKGSDSQSKIITIDTFGGVKQIATSRTTASLYEKQKYPFNAGGVTAAKIQNLYQKDENWKLLEAAFKKDDCDAKSETTISTLASEHLTIPCPDQLQLSGEFQNIVKMMLDKNFPSTISTDTSLTSNDFQKLHSRIPEAIRAHLQLQPQNQRLNKPSESQSAASCTDSELLWLLEHPEAIGARPYSDV